MIYFLLLLLTGCSGLQDSEQERLRKQNCQAEGITRKAEDLRLVIKEPQHRPRQRYPWEESFVGAYPKITREFFRCKGSMLNPPRFNREKGESIRFDDCAGREKHSLPVTNNKEYVYPILIQLLNYLQAQTGMRVVITSGHRCPQHNSYVDPTSLANRTSKHMIGAEVDFYVQGMENRPEEVVRLLMQYYQGQAEYQTFEKADPEDGTSTPSVYNKEIFIKLYKKTEGRNFDNRHPYPYIALQVRYDRETKQKVLYSWDQAIHNYLRW